MHITFHVHETLCLVSSNFNLFFSFCRGVVKPDTVYFVTGDAGRISWSAYPYSQRTFLEFLKVILLQIDFNISQVGSQELAKSDVVDHIVDQWRTIRFIKSQIDVLRTKGYRVRIIPQVEAEELFIALADEKTLAIFHGGHSYTPDGFNSYGLVYRGQGEVFLSVYNDGKPSALTEAVVEKVRGRIGGPHYAASEGIALFFSSACYAGFCEKQIREKLRLSDRTQFITTQDPEHSGPATASTHGDLISSFKNEVVRWITSLPDYAQSECATSLLKIVAK